MNAHQLTTLPSLINPTFYLLGNNHIDRLNFINTLRSPNQNKLHPQKQANLVEVVRTVKLSNKTSNKMKKIDIVDIPFNGKFTVNHYFRGIIYFLQQNEIKNPSHIFNATQTSSSLDISVEQMNIGKALKVMFEKIFEREKRRNAGRISKENLPTIILTSWHNFPDFQDIANTFGKFLINNVYYHSPKIFISNGITMDDFAKLVKCNNYDQQSLKQEILRILRQPENQEFKPLIFQFKENKNCCRFM